MGTSDSRKCPTWGSTAQEKSCKPETRESITVVTSLRNPYTLVLFSVGLSCSTNQGNAKDISVTSKPVFGFGEDGNTITKLAQVRELGSPQLVIRGEGENSYLVATDLKLCEVPSSIFVSRALDMSERGLIGGNIAVDVEGYLNCALQSASRLSRSSAVIHTLQELMSLVPIYPRLEVDVRSSIPPQGRWDKVKNEQNNTH